ncbi:hypothetical protein PLESTB_001349800 [Pleodorina starrii]|uniref:RCC1-like domain-containing protein n=1 Tax=Pleodorina starrii TaxID=330485 RepID=A0A9W6BUL2_9CHLO|nr:hypothetical protein PLESTM_000898800 [Pleodorina starrii]GLC58353.1 hypothetical protein PLESTB_001349800 [Pleodorina starrii]GLC69449.1 hypothetical protein PLESTF_000832000 [Pleodorina starrii]
MGKALHRVLATFGTAADGRLGLGFPLESQFYPRIVASLAGYSIKQIACGGAHTAVVTDDGTLFTFGLNHWGQLGHSRADKFVAAPIEVGLPDPVTAVAAGGHHTLAITAAGEVWSWGMAGEGQLGIGEPSAGEGRQVEPRLVGALAGAGVVSVAAGDHHSLALTSRGELFSWGRGDHGALGHGTVNGYAGVEMSPRQIRSLAPSSPGSGSCRMTSITAGPFSSGAVDSRGTAYVWGYGTGYQLGTGRPNNEAQPVQLDTLPGFVRCLSLGQLHSLAVLGDGRVVAVGMDEHGSLGGGTAALQQRVARRWTEVGSGPGGGLLPPCSLAVAGWKHSAAVSMDGRLFSWGWSGAAGAGFFTDYGGGQLGLGDDEDRWQPEQVVRLHTSRHRYYDLRASYIRARPWRVVGLAAGRNHSAALLETELDMRDLVD